ncbi:MULTISPECIES: hypothetical protein [Trichocoleus]|uniref:TIR domain-containing protein n=1 Tax=Trichocoleus desertorum GB2-A4 TaxID=2933944 RepID=A0ABV0JGS5_9CYAN|nr:hypothetical protein [Trichocoleus sp. FACHB-46]MBD1860077.1 hypothetical protein [Trichocoleus sp. FACHB-46]
MNSNSSNSKPTLFISHKHVDSKIADVIRLFISDRSGGRINVFQSSSPWADGPKSGSNLNQQLKKALWETDVLILLYTHLDQDWSYCMWECGVATHPKSPDTKIILFQCSGSSHNLFHDQVNINVRSLVDIQRFTNEFLTSSDFFPDRSDCVTDFHPNGQEVIAAAARFFQDMQQVLPPEREELSEEWPAYPFLQLEITLQQAKQVCQAWEEQTIQDVNEIIQNNCLISESDKYCEQLFNVPSFERGSKLNDLITLWREAYPHSQSQWVEGLCSQILAGVRWQFPRPVWRLMQTPNGAWCAPMLNRVRRIPSQQCMQFDIYFYKFIKDK